MEDKHKHFFPHILVLLIVLTSVASYYRFIIKQDYMVEYESVCNPLAEKCFIGCEDDACTKEYFYSKVFKYAPDLYRECGKDITNCEAANVCLPDDRKCSITFCDTEVDGSICKIPTSNLNTQSDNI